MEKITAQQMLDCVERELKMRRKVYPGFVRQRKMTEQKAHYELRVMEAICEEYRLRCNQLDLVEMCDGRAAQTDDREGDRPQGDFRW